MSSVADLFQCVPRVTAPFIGHDASSAKFMQMTNMEVCAFQ